MNIVIPIAGANKAPAETAMETEYIKNLQEIEQKTILQYVFESIQSVPSNRFVVVVKREDAVKYHLDNIVRLLRPGSEVVIAESKTMGAACTCMLAVDKLDMDEPLLITYSDHILTVPPEAIIAEFQDNGYDGGIVIFDDVHPRWSYAKLDECGFVIETAEKHPISRNAVAGFYYFKKAAFFFEAAKKMILKNASVNGKYFICPVFNEMILQKQTIGAYRIDKAQYYNFSRQAGIDEFKAYLAELKQQNTRKTRG